MKLNSIILLGLLINTTAIISSDKEIVSLQNKDIANIEIIEIPDELPANQITNTQSKINNSNPLTIQKTQNNSTDLPTFEQFCNTITVRGAKFVYDKLIELTNKASNLKNDKRILMKQSRAKDTQITNLTNQQTLLNNNCNFLLNKMNNSQMIYSHNLKTLHTQIMTLNQKLNDKTNECNTSWVNLELEKSNFTKEIEQRDNIINDFVETNTALKKERDALSEEIQALKNELLKKQKKSKKRKLSSLDEFKLKKFKRKKTE